MREQLVILFVAVALKDSDSVARLLYRIGAPDARANLAAFRSDIDGVLDRHLPRTLGEVNARHLLSDLLDLAVKYRVRVPREYALLSPRLGLDGGHPPAALAGPGHPRRRPALRQGAARPAATTSAISRAGCSAPCSASRGWPRTCRRSCRRSSSISRPGASACTSAPTALEKVNTSLRAAAVIGFLGFCACGFIVGAFISFSQVPWTVRGYPVLGLLGTAAAAALFGAAFTWYLFGNRFGKISLRRLLPGKGSPAAVGRGAPPAATAQLHGEEAATLVRPRTDRRLLVPSEQPWRWDGRRDTRGDCSPGPAAGACAPGPGGLAPRPGDGADDRGPFLVGLQRRATVRRLGAELGARDGAPGGAVLHPVDDPPLRADVPLPLRLFALHLGGAQEAGRSLRGRHHPFHRRPRPAHRSARPAVDGVRPPGHVRPPGPVRHRSGHGGHVRAAAAPGERVRSAWLAPGRAPRGRGEPPRGRRRHRTDPGGAHPGPRPGGSVPRLVPGRPLARGDAPRLGGGGHRAATARGVPESAAARRRRGARRLRGGPRPERVRKRRALSRELRAHPVAPHGQVSGQPELPRLRAGHRLAPARGAVDGGPAGVGCGCR